MERDILHVDMDAFYAAIEQRDHPEWRGKPLIVGASPDQRGVVSTCSYEARVFGVRSAMSSVEAGRRCPHAIFVRPDIARYEAVSKQMFAIFERFTPLVEPLSIDEAFLDITGAHKLFGDNLAIARTLQQAITNELGGLTASIGVASNKFLAKLASEMNKPNGLTIVPETKDEILKFLAPLPVGRLWGVGTVTRATLEQAGYWTIGDIQKTKLPLLEKLVGKAGAEHLFRLSHGEDYREVETVREEKSISREYTFGADCSDKARLRSLLCELAEDVGARLRVAGLFANTVRLKLRWSDFKTITRQMTRETPFCDDFTLRDAVCRLFEREKVVKPVRLIGVGVSGLSNERHVQPMLFDDPVEKLKKQELLSKTVDELRARFGDDRIGSGASRLK